MASHLAMAKPGEPTSGPVVQTAEETWGGLQVDSGYVNTETGLGWIYIGLQPWMWANDHSTWLYIPEPEPEFAGLWSFYLREVISPVKVAAPVMEPAGGTYADPLEVTISTETNDATIRYTTNGNTPTASTGNIYTGPISINSTTTIRAIAYKDGMISSPVTSETYTISAAEGDFPTPETTGWRHTGVTLTPMSGNMTISTDGYVLDSADVSGTIRVTANNVTIKRSRIRAAGGGNAVITQAAGYSNLQVIDCEIDGLGNSSNGVACRENGLVLRCHIYGTSDGVRPWHHTTVQDSYIYLRAPAGAHSDGVQTFGANYVKVLHNWIDIGVDNVTACVFIDNGSHSITVQNNHFEGGSYTLYANSTNLVITDNVFGQAHNAKCGKYGAVTGWNGSATGNVWSNNKFEDGTPVIP